MKAVAYRQTMPIDQPESLIDVTLPDPVASGRDLLVRVEAIAVNPVDTKIRRGVDPQGADKVLGWDAAGTVVAVGPEATLFRPGDAVFYAGALDRAGANSALHLVDERLVGRKPATLDFAQAAALPLTSITAWELLFDRLEVRIGKPAESKSLLVIGGAGGVGSIATQLARRLTGLTVIATASTPESQAWSRQMGAHHVINHREALAPQVRAIVPGGVDYILALTQTDQHFPAFAEIVAPQGKIACIDDPAGPLDISALKRKSVSFHWELMFTRSLYQTPDMIAQHRLLNEVADLVDAGLIASTVNRNLGPINAANLRQAHALIESGRSVGKIVLSGFGD